MSSAGKSSKSASKFSMTDLQDYASARSIKKELASGSSIPNPKAASTRSKGSKKRKVDDSLEELSVIQDQIGDFVSEKLGEVQTIIAQRVDAVERQKLDLHKTIMAKDKKISLLEKENIQLQKEVDSAQTSAQKDIAEIIEGAKHSAAIAFLKIKLQMAEEVEDPGFDRSALDKEAWKQRLVELEEDEDVEGTPRPDVGCSGMKIAEEINDADEGNKQEKAVEEVAKV